MTKFIKLPVVDGYNCLNLNDINQIRITEEDIYIVINNSYETLLYKRSDLNDDKKAYQFVLEQLNKLQDMGVII